MILATDCQIEDLDCLAGRGISKLGKEQGEHKIRSNSQAKKKGQLASW